MAQKLAVSLNGKLLNLSTDTTIELEDVNPLWNDYQSYSLDISIPVTSNPGVVEELANPRSTRRLLSLENARMVLYVDGIPFRTGQAYTNEDEELGDTINVAMVDTVQTLTDMVGDLTCQDIPVKDKIQIGEMIGNVRATVNFHWYLQWKASGKTGFLTWASVKATGGSTTETLTHTFQLQALGFSFPGICEIDDTTIETAKKVDGQPVVKESFINTTDEYPTKAYCNARVCYTHYIKEADGTSGSTVSTSEDSDPYYVLEADRPQSGICFYVLYFLDCLFNYLGFSYSNENLMTVGDMKRLAFFTTKCKYDLEEKNTYDDTSGRNRKYDFGSFDEINKWLDSRNTKGKLEFDYEPKKKLDSVTVNGKLYKVDDELPNGMELKYANFCVEEVKSSVRASIMNMYANSENFPEMNVSTLLDSMWGSFGVKFLVDYEKNIVEPIYIRDVYRDRSEPIVIHGKLLTVVPVSEKVSGVRMRYSDESEASEQANILKKGETDYDTDYDYTDYSHVDTTKTYLSILKQSGSTDTTCYIDLTTGNAYRLKVNGEASAVSDLQPRIFEVGGYHGATWGDCSLQNEDFIEDITSSFQPLILNDVNGRKEKSVGTDAEGYVQDPDSGTIYAISSANSENAKQILAAYVDEDMYHENMEYQIQNVMGNNYIDAYLTEICTTDESYDSSQTDDGNSPLQSVDWGNAITIMRGGGSDATVQTYDYNYDGCGNSKWRYVAGEYAVSPDSLDNWGNEFDYNGTQAGIGDEERFSLKIRAYKEVNGEILCANDVTDANGNIEKKVRSRGLADTFMAEHAHFLLNRRKLRITFECHVSELLNIQWKRRYQIGEYVFWWNKLNYSLSAEAGLGVVTAEVFCL